MKVVVIGAGAMGAAIASHLHKGGHELALIDAADPVIAAIKRDGLSFESPDSRIVWQPKITADPSTLDAPDVLFVMVKGTVTSRAMGAAVGLVSPATTVVTLQNGWGGGDAIAEYVDPEQLVVGVTYSSSTVLGPGKFKQTGAGATTVGPFQEGDSSERADAIAGMLTAAGWPTESSPTVRSDIWKKLILNAATLPPAALTGLNAGALAGATTIPVVNALASEAVAVAQASGLEIDLAERLTTIAATLERAGTGKGSMLQDVLAKRRTEIDTINGAVVRAAESVDVEVPLNRAMVSLVKGLEESWAS